MVTLKEIEDHYSRVWLDLVFFSFDAPIEYQPQYGRELGRAAGLASLILMTDLPPAKKEKLLIGFVQNGIDLWGIVRAGFHGWQAHGGHGSGRKWPIVFAGIMLGDDAMASPNKSYPDCQFGEDMQTLYRRCWTGAKVVYAGHMGVDKNGHDVNTRTPGWGQYEHLQPKDWPIDPEEPGMNEAYRRGCTSLAWVGEALAARLMHAEKYWDHDAFFSYVDRWMTEDDTAIPEDHPGADKVSSLSCSRTDLSRLLLAKADLGFVHDGNVAEIPRAYSAGPEWRENSAAGDHLEVGRVSPHPNEKTPRAGSEETPAASGHSLCALRGRVPLSPLLGTAGPCRIGAESADGHLALSPLQTP